MVSTNLKTQLHKPRLLTIYFKLSWNLTANLQQSIRHTSLQHLKYIPIEINLWQKTNLNHQKPMTVKAGNKNIKHLKTMIKVCSSLMVIFKNTHYSMMTIFLTIKTLIYNTLISFNNDFLMKCYFQLEIKLLKSTSAKFGSDSWILEACFAVFGPEVISKFREWVKLLYFHQDEMILM